MTAASVDGFYNTYGYTDSQWGDLLTSFNGVTITYDDIGNPTSYYNGTSYSFTWQGRRLVGATSAGKTYSFTYNDDGIRTSKTVNGVEHKYYLSGDRIIAEEWDGDMLVYVYDATGSPIGMMYYMGYLNSNFCEKYWFEKNIWGDITGVYDDAGNLLIEYSYDPYGNCTETSVSNSYGAYYNPFRYRGYYYDADLGLYYLNSRYYDSNTCRFISPDGYVSTGQGLTGYNMFAYCGNNPIMRTDPSGQFWIDDDIDMDDFLLEGAGAGGVWGGYGLGSSYHCYLIKNKTEINDARVCGYYTTSSASSISNASSAIVTGAVTVTDNMTTKSIAEVATKGTPNHIGKIGEALAGINPKAKVSIQINGRTRVPDALTDSTLVEVKNVRYISNTQQLRDFADYANATGRTLELYVRPTTRVSKTATDAGWKIRYLW